MNPTHTHTRARTLLAALAVLASLAACSDDPKPAAQPPQVTTPAAPSSAPSTTAPATTSAAPAGNKLGDVVSLTDGAYTVTALAYQQPAATSAPRPPQDGYTWGAANVKTCKIKDDGYDATVSENPWALLLADGGVLTPSSTKYRQFPLPAYPSAPRPLQVGQCISGWIVFPVPQDQRPAQVEYAADRAHPVDWRTG